LRQVWVQNDQYVDDVIRWRSSQDLPPAFLSISSPYDEEAHDGKKRSTQWEGYKVHLTETCEAHLPLIVTHVETTSAPITDDAMTSTIHAGLDRKELLPGEHLVDAGYVDAQLLVESQRDYHIESFWASPQKLSLASRLRTQAMLSTTSPSIGKCNTPPAQPRTHQHQLDSGGRQPGKRGGQDQVLDDRLPGMSGSVAVYPINSPAASHPHHSSPGSIPRASNRGESKRRPGTLPRFTPSEPGLRARSRKGFAPWVCVVPDISVRRKLTCNISPRLLPSILFAVEPGFMVFLALKLGSPLLLVFTTLLRRVRQWYHFW
jgi:hypothetical protein